MEPELIKASSREPKDIGEFAWDTTLNAEDITYGENGKSAVWSQREAGGVGPRLWVPLQSLSRLHSGDFSWSYEIKDMGQAQIGVGFMLDWTIGPDWGVFGYLGSSSSAWAYDPSSGDVVIATASIEGGLPVMAEGYGSVEVQAHLPREGKGLARFVVDGCPSRAVALPAGSVLVPAACLLEEAQSVTLRDFRRQDLDISGWSLSYEGPAESEAEERSEEREQSAPIAGLALQSHSEPTSSEKEPRPGLLSRVFGWLRGSRA